MNQATIFEALVGQTVRANDRAARLVWNAAIVISASLVIFASSRLSVPFQPVPLTMQSIAVILLALVLGPRLATAAAGLYFVQCLTIPGFSAGIMSMTGGYVLGFVAAAAVAGILYRRGHGRSFGRALIASTLANLAIFAVGIPWLAASIGFSKAWAVGGKPFMVAELVKIACGVVLLLGATAAADRLDR